MQARWLGRPQNAPVPSYLRLSLLSLFVIGALWILIFNKPEHPQDGRISFYDFVASDINGKKVDFSAFRGQVVLLVNVASKCGYTEQNYKQLTALHDKYYKKGLRILAFPCNQFGEQEPGTSQEIQEFAKKYGASFLLMEKLQVKGPEAHPLWRWLQHETTARVEWNFFKFLIDRHGAIRSFYGSEAKPTLEQDIEHLL